jgi:hypothetical protein
MFTIEVESDTNDADYIKDSFVVNEETFLFVQNVCNKIKLSGIDYKISVQNEIRFKEYFKSVLTEEELNWLYDCIPRLEGYGMLEGISFYVGKATQLL